ncbi:MAG: hypothetical protein ACI9FB_001360 [Candidatus Azotimanducaceae bacterium]|jgi:uncharacterized protein YigA (DUF484 family)
MTQKKESVSISDRDVASYLEKNPDFFADRHKLLMSLELPHHRSGTVSLVEKQVSLLRERNLSNKKKLERFIQTAKSNDLIFANCQKLILSLISAEDKASFFAALEQSFKRDFKCNAYSLIIFDDDPKQINHFTSLVSRSAATEYVSGLMKNKQATLGALRPSEQDFLFRHQSAKVKSAAVLPLMQGKKQYALLAIGSEDSLYFQSGMGTVFIEFIADVLSLMLPQKIESFS